jgi:hypothetical protein
MPPAAYCACSTSATSRSRAAPPTKARPLMKSSQQRAAGALTEGEEKRAPGPPGPPPIHARRGPEGAGRARGGADRGRDPPRTLHDGGRSLSRRRSTPGETVTRPGVSSVQVLPTRRGPFRRARAPPSAGRGRLSAKYNPRRRATGALPARYNLRRRPPRLLVLFRNKRRRRGRHLLRSGRTRLGSMDLLRVPDNPRPSSPRPNDAREPCRPRTTGSFRLPERKIRPFRDGGGREEGRGAQGEARQEVARAGSRGHRRSPWPWPWPGSDTGNGHGHGADPQRIPLQRAATLRAGSRSQET